MIVNNSLTLYHKTINETTHLEEYTRYNFKYVWTFGGLRASANKGLNNANNITIRIPYQKNEIDITNIAIGDLLVIGDLDIDIESQEDLKDFEVYLLTSITNNTYGGTPHVHLEGK